MSTQTEISMDGPIMSLSLFLSTRIISLIRPRCGGICETPILSLILVRYRRRPHREPGALVASVVKDLTDEQFGYTYGQFSFGVSVEVDARVGECAFAKET